MDFYLKFELISDAFYAFNGMEYRAIDLFNDEPNPVSAKIYSENDTSIGKISGFLLYNDVDFLDRCDAVSGDCEAIASVVCKNDGSVLKKFLSKGNEYDQIFILDKIEINEDFRMKGIATSILTNLPSILSYQFGDVGTTIFLYASDYTTAKMYGFNSLQYKDGTQRLIKFYKQFGYKVASGYVMYWNK